MMRVPVLATIVVAAAVALMVYLGFWQLERAEWKAGLLAEMRAARDLPPVDLDTMPPDRAAVHPFRRARVTCRIDEVRPDQRAGRNLAGQPGYRFLIPCRPAPEGERPPLLIDIGWTRDPRILETASLDGEVTGTLSAGSEEFGIFLTADEPVPPLERSAPPSPDQIPDNHLMYAWQWFLFAGTALLIYIVAVRRRRPERRPG